MVINQNKVIFQMITVTFKKVAAIVAVVVVVVVVVIAEMVKARNHIMVVMVVVITTIKCVIIHAEPTIKTKKDSIIVAMKNIIMVIE